MSEITPNAKQEELITKTEGIFLADAGPGTGKTFTICRRYAHILENDVEPEDILLITFTNSAAENMKERIINRSGYEAAELRDAPISTFHSLCNQILSRYGYEAPKVIGIDDTITSSTRVLENEVLERQEFHRFMDDFIGRYPEYKDFYRIVYSRNELLDLIKSLGAKGIFPKSEGWFRNSETHLDGNFEEFKELFDEMNEPVTGVHGPRQSKLRKKLSGYKDKCFLKDGPSQVDIRGEGTQVPEKFAEICFREDRRELKNFIHDLYFEYIKYALSRNYLNFGFMMMLAFALLCEDHRLRKKLSFDYIMIDEFQDTNEIQFKLALLLSDSGNICVVGDWKQSIFSFQYASVENIVEFEKRLNEFKSDLNSDHTRVDFPIGIDDNIELEENFRSTQEIIDFSEQALLVEATKGEELEKEKTKSRITSLKSVDNEGPTEIRAYTGEDEKELVLWKITELVDDPDHTLIEKGEKRTIDYNDIAVLTRTRNFGLKLLEKAEEHDVPLAYEGGVELFRTKPALLLLAWMRVVQNESSKRGWSVLLDEAGYSMNEIKEIFDKNSHPENMRKFKKLLEQENSIGSLARSVFDRYSIRNAFADKIIETLQSTYDNTYFNRDQMIDFIVANIESQQTYEVDSTERDDVAKIQTIHGSKGLEYPVIIHANMGPGRGGFGNCIEFREPLGLRQKKIFSKEKEDHPYTYDNWKTYVMSKCLKGDYDEERRLLYVAMTRAENYLFFTAEKEKESEFLNNLDIETEVIEPDKIEPPLAKTEDRSELSVSRPKKNSPVKCSVHSIMDKSRLAKVKGKGIEYGAKVHNFAEACLRKRRVEPENLDEEHVKDFLESLEGELIAEVTCLYPINVNGRKVLLHGIIDLIHIQKDSIHVIDYKTDRERSAKDEYVKQLSVYHHVLKKQYPDKDVSSSIFYTEEEKPEKLEVLTEKELREVVEDFCL